MKAMLVATWNVNEEWLADVSPDIVCLQETKMSDDTFPALAFASMGYEAVHHGQGQWNGVAILSKVGLSNPAYGFAAGIDPDPDARLVSATCGSIRVHSVYVPNGRSLDHDHYRYLWRVTTTLPPQILTSGIPRCLKVEHMCRRLNGRH